MVMKSNSSMNNEKMGTLGSQYFTCFSSYSRALSMHEGSYTSMLGVYVHICEYVCMHACVPVYVRTYDYGCLYKCMLNRCSELYYSVLIPHFSQV
jgi:hypothetical protein